MRSLREETTESVCVQSEEFLSLTESKPKPTRSSRMLQKRSWQKSDQLAEHSENSENSAQSDQEVMRISLRCRESCADASGTTRAAASLYFKCVF